MSSKQYDVGIPKSHTHVGEAAMSVCRALNSPRGSAPPGLSRVLASSAFLIERVLQEMPFLARFLPDLSKFAVERDADLGVSAEQMKACGSFRQERHPEWLLLLERKNFGHSEARDLASYELAQALIHPAAGFKLKSARRLLELGKLPKDELARELRALKALAERKRADLYQLCSGKTRQELVFEAELGRYLHEQFAPRSTAVREGRAEAVISRDLLSRVLQGIGDASRQGNALAVCLATAFTAPLSFALLTQVPFAHTAGDDWVACIDLSEGVIKIDLRIVLHGLARAGSRCEPSSTICHFYIPEPALEIFRQMHAGNVRACTLGEIIPTEVRELTGRSQFTFGGLDVPVTIAAFLRSRPVAAAMTGLNRFEAAVGAGALSTIGKSLVHYITFAREHGASVANRYHRSLGLRSSDKPIQSATNSVSFGSRSTPTKDAILDIDRSFVHRYRSVPIGPNSGWASACEFHNAYALAFGHRFALLTAARAQESLNVFADWFAPGSILGFNPDKRTAPMSGMAPVVISQMLAEQMENYVLHLESWYRRAEKRAPLAVRDAIKARLKGVLRGDHVNVLFVINGDELESVGTADLDRVHPLIPLKGDFRRHFMATQLVRSGADTTEVEFVLKHHVASYSPHVDMTMESYGELAERCASAIDRLAIDLGLFPLKGLSASKRRGGRQWA